MPEVRSRRLLSPPFSVWIPIEGDHPSGPRAKSGRLQTGMGGRLPSESVVALRPERVVAFDRNTQAAVSAIESGIGRARRPRDHARPTLALVAEAEWRERASWGRAG